jgi:hypothetical protein
MVLTILYNTAEMMIILRSQANFIMGANDEEDFSY